MSFVIIADVASCNGDAGYIETLLSRTLVSAGYLFHQRCCSAQFPLANLIAPPCAVIIIGGPSTRHAAEFVYASSSRTAYTPTNDLFAMKTALTDAMQRCAATAQPVTDRPEEAGSDAQALVLFSAFMKAACFLSGNGGAADGNVSGRVGPQRRLLLLRSSSSGGGGCVTFRSDVAASLCATSLAKLAVAVSICGEGCRTAFGGRLYALAASTGGHCSDDFTDAFLIPTTNQDGNAPHSGDREAGVAASRFAKKIVQEKYIVEPSTAACRPCVLSSFAGEVFLCSRCMVITRDVLTIARDGCPECPFCVPPPSAPVGRSS